MKIYSGKVCQGVCGTPCSRKDEYGKDLFVGDIVQLWRVDYRGTPEECSVPESGLTAIVQSDGDIFPMGIKGSWLVNDKDWLVVKVKGHEHVVDGENWPDFGFNYSADGP